VRADILGAGFSPGPEPPLTQSADLLIHGRWLLPMEPAGTVLAQHGVAVRAGRIVAIAPSSALRQQFQARAQVELADHVLLPGFVNAHTHAAMSLLRAAPPRGTLQQWLRETIWPLENRWVGAEFVRAGTRLAIAQMLRAGITSFADMYLFPEEVLRLATELRLRVAVGLPIAEARTPWSADARDCLAQGAALWDAHRSNPWVRPYFAPHAPYSVSDDTLLHLRRVADQLDAPLAMHLHETAAEVRESLALHGRRPLARLGQLGLLRPGFTAIHMIHLDEADLELAQRAGLAVAHCPQSNLRHGAGIAPLAALRARGVNVALGTDGAASVGAPDLLAEGRTALLLAAGSGSEAAADRPDAAEALQMATLGGARALGLDAEVGSLVVGKSADLIAVNLARSPALAATGVADALLFDATRSDISDVFVGGRHAVQAGQLELLDLAEVETAARQWMARMGIGAAA
jgi:5-methylthioadenosine/S-adenosylhomocysteine deaminase